MIDEFTKTRIEKLDSNVPVEPSEIIRYVLADIEAGNIKPQKIMVLTLTENDNGSQTFMTYRAGVNNTDQLVIIEHARRLILERMFSHD